MARPHDGTWTPLPGSGPPISGKPFARHCSGGDSATPEAPQGLGEESLGRALLSSTPGDYFPSNFYQLSNQEGKSSGDLTFSSSPAGRQNFEWISQCLIQPSRHCCGMTWKLKTTRGLVRHQLWLSVTGRVGRYLLPSQRAGYKKQGWTAGKGPCAWWPPPDAPLDPSCPAAGPGCPQAAASHVAWRNDHLQLRSVPDSQAECFHQQQERAQRGETESLCGLPVRAATSDAKQRGARHTRRWLRARCPLQRSARAET